MSAEQFTEITQKIDEHFMKTGAVLVGMHQELQEQKQRISHYHEKVEEVTSDLNQRSDEIVEALRAKAEASVAILDQTSGLVERLKGLVTEADISIEDAQEKIKDSHVALISEAKELAASLDARRADFKNEVLEFIDKASNERHLLISDLMSARDAYQTELDGRLSSMFLALQKQQEEVQKQTTETQNEAARNFASASNDLRLEFSRAISTADAEHTRMLSQTDKTFSGAVNRLEERIEQHLDAHKRFLKSSYEELADRQRRSDEAFQQLQTEAKRHQDEQVLFARRTRYITSGLLASGLLFIALAFLRSGS